jgi:hypothetical protein
LNPIISGIEGESRSVCTGYGSSNGRKQVGIHIPIDVMTRSHDVRPVNPCVADKKPEMICHLVTQINTELRNDAEFVLTVLTGIGIQSEETGVVSLIGWDAGWV